MNALAINSGVTGIGGFFFADDESFRTGASSRPWEITVTVVPFPPALIVADVCRNNIAARPITSELCLEVDVETPLFFRIKAAREIHAQHAIEHRLSVSDATQRTTESVEVHQRIPLAGPAEVAKQNRAMIGVVASDFHPREPERIARLCDAGVLAAHGLRSTQVPRSLRRKRSDRAAEGQRQRSGGSKRQPVRHREIHGGAAECRILLTRLESRVSIRAESTRIESV